MTAVYVHGTAFLGGLRQGDQIVSYKRVSSIQNYLKKTRISNPERKTS